MQDPEPIDPGIQRFLDEKVRPFMERAQQAVEKLRVPNEGPDLRTLRAVSYDIDTAEQLISIFDRHQMFRAPGGIEARTTGTNRFIFRGQGDSRWPLLPSSLRWSDTELSHASSLPPEKATLYAKDHLMAELIGLKDFLLQAASLGFPVPAGPEQLFEYMLPIELAAWSGKVPELSPLPVQILDAMALAQHHGVRTRLLDWTESPYTAAFFAAYAWSSVGPRFGNSPPDAMVVHCLNQARLGSYPRVKAYIPERHNKAFIRAQRGVFVMFKAVIDTFIETRRWHSLEDLISADDGRVTYVNEWPAIVSFRLPTTQADATLRLLYNRNLSRATLMPNLDNIAADRAYVQRLFGD